MFKRITFLALFLGMGVALSGCYWPTNIGPNGLPNPNPTPCETEVWVDLYTYVNGEPLVVPYKYDIEIIWRRDGVRPERDRQEGVDPNGDVKIKRPCGYDSIEVEVYLKHPTEPHKNGRLDDLTIAIDPNQPSVYIDLVYDNVFYDSPAAPQPTPTP